MDKRISLSKGVQKRKGLWMALCVSVVVLLVVGYLFLRQYARVGSHFMRLRKFWSDPEKYSEWGLKAGGRCGEAPFLFPTDGFVAFFWGDRYTTGKRHQGVDIFSPEGPDGVGLTPVVAVYDGYLTRLSDWRSAVILRIPEDPLQNGRQIWVYYAHMADADGNSFIMPDFPPGTSDKFVQAGTLLGYQGNYSANPANPTGVHLHLSIVLDDGRGSFKNELEFRNTLDPSPYTGIELSGERIGNRVATCTVQ